MTACQKLNPAAYLLDILSAQENTAVYNYATALNTSLYLSYFMQVCFFHTLVK